MTKCYQALDNALGEVAMLADPDFKLAAKASGALDWTIINCPIKGGEQNMVASMR